MWFVRRPKIPGIQSSLDLSASSSNSILHAEMLCRLLKERATTIAQQECEMTSCELLQRMSRWKLQYWALCYDVTGLNWRYTTQEQEGHGV